MVDEVWIEIQVDCRQVPIGEQGGDQFLGNLLVASDGHAAMISCASTRRPPELARRRITRRGSGSVEAGCDHKSVFVTHRLQSP
jgi:hypothetical protein